MTPQETKHIYEKACRARRMVPQEDEGRSWHKVLKDYEARDVDAALEAWWGSDARESNGDLKSRWLPAPVELGTLSKRAQMKRLAYNSSATVLVVRRCPACGSTTSGFSDPNETRTRYCQGIPRRAHESGEICGEAMERVL